MVGDPCAPVITPRLALLTTAHFTVDVYSSFFSPLLPLLATRLGMNLAMVGTLVALASLSSSFSQPLFGLLADRLRRPWLIGLGPLVAAGLMSSVGLAPTFAALVGILMVGGLGVSWFHPQSAVLATAVLAAALAGHGGVHHRRHAGRARWARSSRWRWWAGSGSSAPGWSCSRAWWWPSRSSPCWRGAVPREASRAGVPARGVPARCAGPGRVRVRVRSGAPQAAAGAPSLRELRPVLRPLALLYVAVVARSAVSYGFMTFLPMHLHELGYSVAVRGLGPHRLSGAGRAGRLRGWLAGRAGRRPDRGGAVLRRRHPAVPGLPGAADPARAGVPRRRLLRRCRARCR